MFCCLGVLLLFAQAAAPNEPAPAMPEHLKSAAGLVASGKYKEAQAELAQLDPKLAGVLHLLGVTHYNLREYAKAADALVSAMESEDPSSPAYRESSLLAGQSNYLLGKYTEAVPLLRKAQAAGSDSPELAYMLGVSYIHLVRSDDATTAFAAMFAVPADSAAALLLTAQMMFRFEYLERAEPLLRKALEIDPRLPGAHQLLGEIATFRNDIERAVAALTQELQVNPNSPNAYYKLGDAYSRREDWARAIPALQKSIWLNPFNSGPYILLGKAYLKQEQLANAEGMLRRSLQMDPQNASAHYLLGRTLLQLGRTEEGRAMMKRSQELKPADR